MLGVDKIGEIQRAHYRDGRSIRGISRDLGISRATVWKILRSGATSFRYERQTQPRPKIGPLQSELEGMQSESAARPKRERMTLMRIFQDLRVLGYDAVRRYALRWIAGREGVPPSNVWVILFQKL